MFKKTMFAVSNLNELIFLRKICPKYKLIQKVNRNNKENYLKLTLQKFQFEFFFNLIERTALDFILKK